MGYPLINLLCLVGGRGRLGIRIASVSTFAVLLGPLLLVLLLVLCTDRRLEQVDKSFVLNLCELCAEERVSNDANDDKL